MHTYFQDVLAELRPDEVNFILSQLPEPFSPTPTVSTVAPDSAQGDNTAENEAESEARKRRHIEREWPAMGTMLYAEYFGERYEAEIIPAMKKLKSAKQIKIASGPSRGALCDSFSEAMLAATEMQRAKQNLGRRGTGNGWVFWQWDGKPENIAGEDARDDEQD